MLLNIRNPVTLTSTDERIPLPDPRYLKVHAACAKIAHLSGAGEYILKLERDMEEMDVLAEDGGSMNVLEYALQAIGVK